MTLAVFAGVRALLGGWVFFEVVQGRERFVGDVPLTEDLVYHAGRESGRYEAAHYARGVLRTLWFWKAFSAQVLAGEGFFIGIGVASFDGLGNHLRGHTFLSQRLADAALTELLILLAKSGIDLGVRRVVDVAVFLESSDGRVDNRIATLAGLDAHAHQAAEFGFGAHVAAESLDGVVVEAGFVEVRFGFHGLAMSLAVAGGVYPHTL
jgi:hypothetical protein